MIPSLPQPRCRPPLASAPARSVALCLAESCGPGCPQPFCSPSAAGATLWEPVLGRKGSWEGWASPAGLCQDQESAVTVAKKPGPPILEGGALDPDSDPWRTRVSVWVSV